jgi:S1-C subfamily serine protease
MWMQEEQGGSEYQQPEYPGSWATPADEGARQPAEPGDPAPGDGETAPGSAAPGSAAPGSAAPGSDGGAATGRAVPGLPSEEMMPGGSAAPGAYGEQSQPGPYGPAGGYSQGAAPWGGYGQPGGYAVPGAQAGYSQGGGYGQPAAPTGGYGQPGTPGGYGQPTASGQPGTPGGYGQPTASGQPGGFGQPTGYGYPGSYGGYGQAPGPAQADRPGQAGGFGPPGAYGPPADFIEQGPRRRRARGLLAYVLVAAVAAGAGAGTVLLLGNHNGSTPASSGSPLRGSGNGGGLGNGGGAGNGSGGTGFGPSAGMSSAALRSVVNAVSPGIVDITSNLGFEGGTAAATGMVISSSGLVLTNNHVISGTTGLTATLVRTGQRFSAKWLGYDKNDDVAVLQLQNVSGLTTVPLGNSSTVKLGAPVVALGNAEGAGGAPAVSGAITGLNRTITASDNGSATSETLHGMMQTNAGIVEGDSGGPLADASGRVVGMDTAASTGTFGGSVGQQNVGFAIPIDKALSIAHQISSGQASSTVQIGPTGFIGVFVPGGKASQSSDPRVQRRLQGGAPAGIAPVKSGALIIGDLCGTPSASAGIRAGDVITAVNGRAVTSPDVLDTVMQQYKPGVSVSVTWVDTSGTKHTQKLSLIEAPPK